MIVKNTDNTQFGWHYKMHADILRKSAILSNLPESIISAIEQAVQKPDFDEFFLYGQKHFYYPNDRIKSYLDYTKTHNAKYMYQLHLKKMYESLKLKNLEQGFSEAGRALHYLQDMTQPNHIDSGSIIKKALEKKSHHKFEMDIFGRSNDFYAQTKPLDLKSKTLETLFDEVISISQKNQTPNMTNIDDWDIIAQNAINLATSATRKFLALIKSIG